MTGRLAMALACTITGAGSSGPDAIRAGVLKAAERELTNA